QLPPPYMPQPGATVTAVSMLGSCTASTGHSLRGAGSGMPVMSMHSVPPEYANGGTGTVTTFAGSHGSDAPPLDGGICTGIDGTTTDGPALAANDGIAAAAGSRACDSCTLQCAEPAANARTCCCRRKRRPTIVRPASGPTCAGSISSCTRSGCGKPGSAIAALPFAGALPGTTSAPPVACAAAVPASRQATVRLRVPARAAAGRERRGFIGRRSLGDDGDGESERWQLAEHDHVQLAAGECVGGDRHQHAAVADRQLRHRAARLRDDDAAGSVDLDRHHGAGRADGGTADAAALPHRGLVPLSSCRRASSAA